MFWIIYIAFNDLYSWELDIIEFIQSHLLLSFLAFNSESSCLDEDTGTLKAQIIYEVI